VRLNTKTRKITMECWPRNVDITDPKAKQYPGWPRTIDQQDNYSRKAVAHLPTLKISKPGQVVQILKGNELVYALRVSGTSFQPKVFDNDAHTIQVGEGDAVTVLKNIKPGDGTLDVKL
jgi:hypothetical protein